MTALVCSGLVERVWEPACQSGSTGCHTQASFQAAISQLCVRCAASVHPGAGAVPQCFRIWRRVLRGSNMVWVAMGWIQVALAALQYVLSSQAVGLQNMQRADINQ
jgi:hypothetical protein